MGKREIAAIGAGLLWPAAVRAAAAVEETMAVTGLSRDVITKALAESMEPAPRVLDRLRRQCASGELDHG